METSKDSIIITNKEDLKSVMMEMFEEWKKHNEEKLLTPEEVKRFLSISNTTMWRFDNEGKLKPIYFDGKKRNGIKRYRKSDIDELINKIIV